MKIGMNAQGKVTMDDEAQQMLARIDSSENIEQLLISYSRERGMISIRVDHEQYECFRDPTNSKKWTLSATTGYKTSYRAKKLQITGTDIMVVLNSALDAILMLEYLKRKKGQEPQSPTPAL